MNESDIFYHKAKKMAAGLISKKRQLKIAANKEVEAVLRKLQFEYPTSLVVPYFSTTLSTGQLFYLAGK